MRWLGGGAGSRGAAERTLVGLYWLVSGYGLRAWRVIATLVVVVALVAVGVKYAGFPGEPVPYVDALLYSVRSAFLINVKTTSVPETVTRWGEVFRTALAAAVASAASASASGAARSVFVEVNNWTQCEMDFHDADLSHGVWSGTNWPPSEIINSTWGDWSSESNGVFTGTEGTASSLLRKCVNPANNFKVVKFHWNNPYVGANSYDNSGTSSGVKITRSGGSGNNAVVQFRVETS
ncbi:hypothetical protein ACGFNU_37105 [Spirillospora sp. NPDC048911]|uniref:hypothetical protein n=1 Tax=Spirillospora sp. NPDC048911 TaxID=3364527 RepID=UPI003715C541